MHRAKGPTARWANKLLGRVGKPFWQESTLIGLCAAHLSASKFAGGRESGSEYPRGLKSALRCFSV
jgi:hypothetical protein